MKYKLLLTLLVLLTGFSCKKEKSQSDIDEEIIINYLRDSNLEAIRHSSGLYYIITEEGTGGSPSYYSTITVKYKGYLTDGSVFDQTTDDETFTYALNQLIKGWVVGLPLLKKGGKGTFLIPSDMGYGAYDYPGIPSNSVLIFEIELINYY